LGRAVIPARKGVVALRKGMLFSALMVLLWLVGVRLFVEPMLKDVATLFYEVAALLETTGRGLR
jgi:hypothetical protein